MSQSHSAPEPVAERRRGREAELGPGLRDVGEGVGHVAFLGLRPPDDRPEAGDLLHDPDHVGESLPVPAAGVIDFARPAPVRRGQVGGDDVVDEREVAGLRAVSVQGDLPALVEGPEEAMEGHVGPLARPVNREEAERHDGHAEILEVEKAELLGRKLRDPVGGQGMERARFLHREVGRQAVDRGGRGVDDAARRPVLGRLQEPLGGADIGGDVGLEGRAPARPDAGLRRQVEDDLGPRDERSEVDVVEVRFEEREARPAEEAGDVPVLDPPRIVIGHGVDARHRVARVEKAAAEAGADEARRRR